MRNLNRPWTAEEEVHLRQLLEAGESILLVAAKLKRTPSAVKNRKVAAHIRAGAKGETKKNVRSGRRNQKWINGIDPEKLG